MDPLDGQDVYAAEKILKSRTRKVSKCFQILINLWYLALISLMHPSSGKFKHAHQCSILKFKH